MVGFNILIRNQLDELEIYCKQRAIENSPNDVYSLDGFQWAISNILMSRQCSIMCRRQAEVYYASGENCSVYWTSLTRSSVDWLCLIWLMKTDQKWLEFVHILLSMKIDLIGWSWLFYQAENKIMRAQHFVHSPLLPNVPHVV